MKQLHDIKAPLKRKVTGEFGDEYRRLMRLGLPVLVTQVGIIVVSFADTMMVGAYGLNELAAAAFVNSIFMVAVVMQIGFAAGMTPLVGALYGRGERKEAGRVMRAGLQLNAIVSIGFTALMGTIFFFLDHFGQDPELMPLIREYYLIILATLLPMAIFNCCQQTANATTDTATPMWIIPGGDLLNIFGNWILIFGKLGCPELGLAGAGFSTLLTRVAAMLAILAVIRFRKRYRPYYKGAGLKAGGALRRKIWATSYPVMIQNGVECGLWSAGAIVSGWFGKVQLAAYQVINTISQLGFMTFISFGVATSIRVANCTGARDIAGIRRSVGAGLRINLLLATAASLTFIFATRQLVHLFSPDAEVTASAVTLIIPLVIYQYLDATQLTYANALRGTSDVKPLLWISLASYIGVGIPVMMVLAVWADMGNVGVYYSFTGALLCASLMLISAFRKAARTKGLEFRGEYISGDTDFKNGPMQL